MIGLMASDLVTARLVKGEGELLRLTGLHPDSVLLMRRLNARSTDQGLVQHLALVDEREQMVSPVRTSLHGRCAVRRKSYRLLDQSSRTL